MSRYREISRQVCERVASAYCESWGRLSAPGFIFSAYGRKKLVRVLLKRWSRAVILVLGSILVAGCVTTEVTEPIRIKAPAVVTPIVIEVAPAAQAVTKIVAESTPVRAPLVTNVTPVVTKVPAVRAPLVTPVVTKVPAVRTPLVTNVTPVVIRAPSVVIERSADVTQRSVSGGSFVGESTHEYAIAYHPYPHVIYEDGWYALFFDGENAVVAYSDDGKTFVNHTVVSHSRVPLGGAAIYLHNESVFVVYPDTNNMKLYLRRGTAFGGHIFLSKPIEVLDMGVSFAVKIPSLLFDDEDVPYIVFSGLEGWGGEGGSRWRAWIMKATSRDLSQWSEPVVFSDVISPNQEAAASASGVFVGTSQVLIHEVRNQVFVRGRISNGKVASGPLISASGLNYLADTFKGTHDYAVASDGDRLHVVYHSVGNGPDGVGYMVYRDWTRRAGWSERTVLGATSAHHTALAVDTTGNVWVFYGTAESIRVRVLQPGFEAFEAEKCVISVLPEDRASHAWLSAASGGENPGVGLLWMEQHVDTPAKPADGRWNVRFRAFTLDEILALPTCAA